MKRVSSADEVINSKIINPGSIIYAAGNAAAPQELLLQLATDLAIKDVDIFSILLLGERLAPLFSRERCQDLTHRVIFNSYLSKEAVNNGWAKYHPMHLSEVPRYIRRVKPNGVLLTVSSTEKDGNYSLG
ncbi:MAG: acetyl-CoA hydrolase, partial [candidate division Zixibacteria bacterium]|nr:acetyl-CoA hydrolase [candidate division Zixibacteria bacterium]